MYTDHENEDRSWREPDDTQAAWDADETEEPETYEAADETPDMTETASAPAGESPAPQAVPVSEPANNYGGRYGSGRTYYEPWREPVYKEPEERAYTPGIGAYSYQRGATQRAQETEKPRKSHGFLKAVCLVLACAIVSSIVSYGVVNLRSKELAASNTAEGGSSGPTTVVLNSAPAATADTGDTAPAKTISANGSIMSAQDIYAMACEQVVGIRTPVTTTNIFGQTTSGAVSGSGFIISADGYILTNYHVIKYSAQYGYDLTVILRDGSEHTASIVGYEAENDVAVIKIDASGLNAATLGKSADMIVGETVYAVGNPLGELEYTMTSGIVSALDRVITTTDPDTKVKESINMFQIDASVNSGNSGGPVYNQYGEVIGIVSAKYSSTGVEGLGFAIPIDDALTIASDLIENGYVTGKAYFGITVSTMTASYAQYYGLVPGALVESVADDSCAATAGLQPGDIITKLGDYEIDSRDALLSAKKNFRAGDVVSVTAFRNGEYLEFILTFDEAPATTVNTETQQQQQQNSQPQNGWGDWGDFGNFGSFGTNPSEG